MASTFEIQLVGYTITEQIYTGTRTLVYRGICEQDQKPVVLKLMRSEYPSFNELLQFRNQYSIAKNLDISGIVKPKSLEIYRNGYALVMEDTGDISLKEYTNYSAIGLEEFLIIAIQIVTTLAGLIRQRVIHKDIKPTNILINPETKQVNLIDFSIASLLPREIQELQSPDVLEGTLAYLSPEQTGRMNRGIDYRTDFYSLGITFYELLTGQLPFQSDDPIELVHAHLAKQATPPHEINDALPLGLSNIVTKLMAKNAEDRYQSALGLKYDLEICLSSWQKIGKVPVFELGQRDIQDRFIIPEKLYGREKEVNTLLDAFDRVANPQESSPKNSSVMMLVAGFSGIGKTSVVNEVHKPIVRQRGYFIKGKFDQFQRNIPFSAFVQAFRDLMGQVLTESCVKIQDWKEKILTAIGDSGQVIIEVIPELEYIIGKQPSVPELSGAAAQNRFNLLFEKFIQVFTSKEHPLVMFLDDLQWADSASLTLMQLLMNERKTGYLLLIGAYRDNEVFPAHPLMLTLEEIRKANGIVDTMVLAPLTQDDINSLISETLHCSLEIAQPLTELVYQKTKGNPFFTTQFLKALYEDEWITFNEENRYWQCQMAEVRSLALTDNVVEFMAQQLQKLPQQTQNVLKLAACIGNQFDLETLAIVHEKSQVETSVDLWKALQEGLILPTNEVYKFYQYGNDSILTVDSSPLTLNGQPSTNYRFLHDRIQQAAYFLIPEEHKQVTHLKIGQLLLSSTSEADQEEKIFAITNQLNLGRALFDSDPPKYQLAQLNLQAGQKSKLSTAYQAAKSYFLIGIELLPESSWQTNYTLIYTLYKEGAEAAYLASDFEQAEELYRQALDCAQTSLDKAIVYRIQMTQYHHQGRNPEAIAIQRKILAILGWNIPIEAAAIQASLDEEIATVNRFLVTNTIESILDAPKMQDATVAEMLRIIQILFYAAWLDGQPTLGLLALAKMTTLSLQHGNSDMSPFGYVGYGLIANGILKDAKTAHRFGQTAVQLCEQFDNSDVRGMTNFLFAADVHSWSCPIRNADVYYENAYKYGMEAGNWLTVGFMMMQSGSDRLTYGKNLNDLYQIAQTHADFLQRIKSFDNLDALTVGVLQPIRNLLGLTKTFFTFDDDTFSEAHYVQKYAHAPYQLAWLYSVKIRHAYLFKNTQAYSDLINKLSIIENTIPSHAKVPSSVFYVVLMHLALAETASEESDRQTHWQAIIPLEERLNFWSTNCPENLLHKCLLIQAEKARTNGQKTEAIDLYDRAIAEARRNEYGYEEGLANELAALFYLEWGKEKIAQVYMQEAYYCYARWEAKAKTNDLEQRYPQLLAPIFQRDKTIIQSTESLLLTSPHTQYSTSTRTSSELDFASLTKVSQALSREIHLNELLAKIMQVTLENAGAKFGALILLKNNNLVIEARARIQSSEDNNIITCIQSVPIQDSEELPLSIINYIQHTQETLVIDDAILESKWAADRYIEIYEPRSILCMPILNQGKFIGLLYLENHLLPKVFTKERLEILNLLCLQAGISLENAQLYHKSQEYAQQLEKSLADLQQAQLHLVQSEKMSVLGNLVAGVAHEINNPVGFIIGNIQPAYDGVQDLFDLLDLYQEKFPVPGTQISNKVEAIDLEYLRQDLPELIDSMKEGAKRICTLSQSLRTFSRADTTTKKPFDIHEGIDSTILILKHRLKATENRPAIEVIKNYHQLPLVNCFAGQLNQVFMNILANAIDAIEEANINTGLSFADIEDNPNQITVTTTMSDDKKYVVISIKDNGMGMPQEVKQKIFDYLYTTKPIGKGTGLGLAIARQIVLEKHNGTLDVHSTLGKGTEFIIKLPI